MGEKGLIEEDWKDRDKWKKKDKVIVKWAQEDVETSNNLLNKIKICWLIVEVINAEFQIILYSRCLTLKDSTPFSKAILINGCNVLMFV